MTPTRLTPRAWLVLAVLALGLAGCQEQIDEHYGLRGGVAVTSVNGTGVLGQLFSDRGHRVSSWRWLSPKLDDVDTLVWFPDDFSPPGDEVREWFELWLVSQPGRTLIYVGRDYNAGPVYWRWMKSQAGPATTAEVRRKLIDSEQRWDSARGHWLTEADCPWFRLENHDQAREIRDWKGAPRWTEGIQPAQCQIEIQTRLEPSEWATPLLWSDDDVLVSREPFQESQLLLVANGSFLLNAPLVNPEHRKLAGRLIDEVGPPGRVVFLESSAGGPPIRNRDPKGQTGGLDLLGVWPMNAVIAHLAVMGVLLWAWRFPIFGTAREPRDEWTGDFGKHVDAVGKLLARGGDAAFAMQRREHYLRTLRGEPTAVLPGAAPRPAAQQEPQSPFLTSPGQTLSESRPT